MILEFEVEDVDAEQMRLKPLVAEWVLEPTTQPWGNRSMLFRDPDGNLINVYTPPEAVTQTQPRSRRRRTCLRPEGAGGRAAMFPLDVGQSAGFPAFAANVSALLASTFDCFNVLRHLRRRRHS